jgi:hypothetical protein
MIRKITVCLALMIFALSVPAMAAEVSGDWQLKRVGPQGEEVWDLTFAATGSEFAVTGTHSALGEVTGSGKVDGSSIEMLNYLATPMGRIHVKFEGVLEGDKMSGTSKSVGIDMAEGGGGGAPGGAPQGAPGAGAPGGAPGEGAPEGGAPQGPPGGGAPAGGSDGGGVDHTQPIAFTGVKK